MTGLRYFILLVLGLNVYGALLAAPLEADKEAVAKLLAGFPTTAALDAAFKALSSAVPTTEDERKQARERLAVAKDRIPKLRLLLTPGASVFDYPGLLAAGYCIFTSKNRKDPDPSLRFYRLFIGSSDGTEEFEYPTMLLIDFDQKGIITKIGRPGKATL